MVHTGKYYLTKQGLAKIKKEYEELLKIRRAILKKGAPPFLHSEELNAEFVSFKEDNEYLASKIEELEHILNNFEIIKPSAKDRICLGARVVIEVKGKEREFMIVGTLEADPINGKISKESPVGRALLGHKVGDIIKLSSPIKATYKIKSIKY